MRRKPCTSIATPIEQAHDHYCGAACGAMVLRTVNKAPAGSDTVLQDKVWAKVQLHSTGTSWTSPPSCVEGSVAGFATQHCYVCGPCWKCWASTADALASALDDFGAAADVVRDNVPAADLLQAAVASLDQSFPAIVGMSTSTHWMVLAGYCLDKGKPHDSQSLNIGNKWIGSFFLIDPMLPYGPGELHAKPAFQVLLGIGAASCGPSSDNGHSLAIVKARSVKKATIAMTQTTNVPPSSAGGLHARTLISEMTLKTVQEGLALDPEWAYAFHGALPQNVTPVQLLDEKDAYYYIVDFGKAGGITGRVAVRVTVVEGRLQPLILSVRGATIPGTFLAAFVTPAETLAPREGKAFSEGDERIVRKDAIGVHPVLVWRDCFQSHSEMWPFYVITHGARRYYQRVDGRIFPELTASLPGY